MRTWRVAGLAALLPAGRRAPGRAAPSSESNSPRSFANSSSSSGSTRVRISFTVTV